MIYVHKSPVLIGDCSGLDLPKKKYGSNRLGIGMRKERLVKRKLEGSGFNVKQSPGSRGASDLYAQKRGKKWHIQVKSTRKKA